MWCVPPTMAWVILVFDFLFSVTGWDVGSSLIAHSSQDPYWRTFLVGVLNTCFAAAICVTLASILGTVVGLLAVSDNPLISGPCLLYVNAIRNIPQILLVFLFYHACLQLPPARESLSLFGATFLNNRGLYAPSLELRERGIWLLPWALTAVLLCWLVLRLSRRLGAGSWREAIPLGAASLVGFCAVVALARCSAADQTCASWCPPEPHHQSLPNRQQYLRRST